MPAKSKRSKPFKEELVKDASDLIVNDPATVKTGSKVIDAVEEILKDPRTETVYVVDAKGIVKGIITTSDLLKVSSIQMGAHNRSAMLNFFSYMNLVYSEHVEDIMRKAYTIDKNDKLIKALKIMESRKLSDLPIVDKNNKIIGELNGLEILTVMHNKIKSGEINDLM